MLEPIMRYAEHRQQLMIDVRQIRTMSLIFYAEEI